MYYGNYYGEGGLSLILLVLITIVPIIANFKVQNAFNKYSRIRSLSGYTGEEAARRILSINNLNHVAIGAVRGSMTDHYNPLTKQLALSETVYGNSSIAAISVAAHEAGHALQDAQGYSFLKLRHRLFPVTNFANRAAIPLIMIGLIMPVFGGLTSLGILLFAVTTLFAIVTLPVEFNASKRALAILSDSGIMSHEEIRGAKEVLDAAALTYVAGAVASLMMLLRFILIFGGRNDD